MKISVSVQSSFKNHRLGKESVRTLFKPEIQRPIPINY